MQKLYRCLALDSRLMICLPINLRTSPTKGATGYDNNKTGRCDYND